MLNPVELFARWRMLLRDPSDPEVLAVLADITGDTPEALTRLAEFTNDPFCANIATMARSPLEYEFLRCIRRNQRITASGSGASRGAHLQMAPSAVDALQNQSAVTEWSTAQWLNALLNRDRTPRRRLAVVTGMRDDGLSILEWVAHYRALGVDSIYVYTNDNSDGSEALLQELAHHEVITLVDNRCDLEAGVHPQRKAYAHALNLLPELWDHEWAFFLDSDELFIPSEEAGLTLGAVLDRVDGLYPLEKPSALMFNWRWYQSGESYAYQDDLLLTRFPHAREHNLQKSLVRIRDVVSMVELHFPTTLNDGFYLRGDLSRRKISDRWDDLPPVYDFGQVNHYWNKSFEEYANKKARGETIHFDGSFFTRSFDEFFLWNGPEALDNHHPAQPALIENVRSELESLLALPSVSIVHAKLRADFPARVRAIGGTLGLPVIYEATRVVALQKDNLALGRPARQSSYSDWSVTDESGRAVAAEPPPGAYSFHTDLEKNPWWEVDLEAEAEIDSVFIYNSTDDCADRAQTLQVALSVDGEQYTVVYDHAGCPPFGGQYNPESKLTASPPLCVLCSGHRARYVRLQLQDSNYLHLLRVEVYGNRPMTENSELSAPV